jgi:CDP-glycerol glycerophosphotransferase
MSGQPLISVIIPVHDVAEYLDDCLDSVLGQSLAAVEVIAVESASRDRSGAILDARAQADPRLHAMHIAQHGPGRARNAALAQAAGEYVWFVDADDIIPPGSMAAIAETIENERSDVILIDFAFLYPGGQTKASPGRDLLREAPAGSFSLVTWPAVIGLTATVWSKVFRRDFLLGLGISFPDGIHEDVPVSFGALLSAKRIRAMNRVCYHYRQRPGSFMASATQQHFDIFGSYRQVFDLAEKLQSNGAGGIDGAGGSTDEVRITDEVRTALFERAIGHYATNLDGDGGGRVPRCDRRRYFTMMHDDFIAYRPAAYHPPGGFRGLKYRLIERNAYRAYAVLARVNRARVQVMRG